MVIQFILILYNCYIFIFYCIDTWRCYLYFILLCFFVSTSHIYEKNQPLTAHTNQFKFIYKINEMLHPSIHHYIDKKQTIIDICIMHIVYYIVCVMLHARYKGFLISYIILSKTILRKIVYVSFYFSFWCIKMVFCYYQ